MASASDPPAHPALQPADRLILPPLPPRAAVETSIGPPHYPAESTQSHAFVQPSLRARKGHANSDSFRRHRAGSKMPKERFFTAISRGRVVSRARCLGFLAGVAAGSRPRSSATATMQLYFRRSGSSRDTVLQNQVERAARKWLAALAPTRGARPGLTIDPAGFELLLQQPDRAEFGIAAEDRAHDLRLAAHDDEFAVLCPITKRRHSACRETTLQREIAVKNVSLGIFDPSLGIFDPARCRRNPDFWGGFPPKP